MNEETFLFALRESPNDEVTWLALADWFEENGQSDRAELIRLTRRLRTLPVMKRSKARVTAERRLCDLLNAGVRPVVPEIVNSIGMRLALIPPGRFRMGSPSSERSRGEDELLHEVEITRPFYFGVFPVTQSQYESVMGNNPAHFCASGEGATSVKKLTTREFPAEWMSFTEAREFCRRLSQSEKDQKPRRTYRLPTEAEWEYGCRGGSASTTAFHYGATVSSTQANFDGDSPYGGAEEGPDLCRPTPVGAYLPNVFGLYDMHGNVHEWCSDWYDGDYYSVSPRTDPTGPSRGSQRCLRGGCWRCAGRMCRSADRASDRPAERDLNTGFRVVMTVAKK